MGAQLADDHGTLRYKFEVCVKVRLPRFLLDRAERQSMCEALGKEIGRRGRGGFLLSVSWLAWMQCAHLRLQRASVQRGTAKCKHSEH